MRRHAARVRARWTITGQLHGRDGRRPECDAWRVAETITLTVRTPQDRSLLLAATRDLLLHFADPGAPSSRLFEIGRVIQQLERGGPTVRVAAVLVEPLRERLGILLQGDE
jgi:hypothetical protein